MQDNRSGFCSISSGMVITLDAGGSSIKSGIVDARHTLCGEPLITAIHSAGAADTLLDCFASVIRIHLSRVNPEELRGICLAFPGPFDYKRGICYIKHQAKYAQLYGVDIGSRLGALLALRNIPLRFTGDAEAAIIGEARYGAGRPFARIIGITLGSGFGSAFIADGNALTSGRGVPAEGWLYAHPFRGTKADELFSSRGIIAALSGAGVAAGDVAWAAEIARHGNPDALRVFTAFGHDLGTFLVPFVRSFQADAVLVTGGIAGAIDLFGEALAGLLPVPVIPSHLSVSAPLLGAADVIFQAKD